MLEQQEVALTMLKATATLIAAAEQLWHFGASEDHVAFEQHAMNMLQEIQKIYIHTKWPHPESIMDSLKRIMVQAKAKSKRTLNKIEFELLPLMKEFYQVYYYFSCVYPDKVLMEKYYEHDMVRLGANKYIDESVKTGIYKYELSIAVLAFNKLEYTKLCVESLLRNIPQNLNYELILINHGSTDGTKEYFESIAPTKQLDFLINGGGIGAFTRLIEGKYLLFVSNDVIVAENAIPNMISCMESDEKIVWVVPTTPNVSNLQTIPAEYKTIDEMLSFARKNNKYHDPYHWEQRVRLCDPISLRRTSVAFSSYGVFWSYYIHTDMNGGCGFTDDKEALFYRRNGYKMMLAKDSYCYHFGSITLRDEVAKQDSFYEKGRKAFYDAFGIDPWGTGCCWSKELMSLLSCREDGHVDILGVNCGIGSNPLKIKESLKENAYNLDVILYNVTDDKRYVKDLPGVSDVFVYLPECCDVCEIFPEVQFNYIVLEGGLEKYPEPLRMVKELKARLVAGGFMAVQTSDLVLKKNIFKNFPGADRAGDWCVISEQRRISNSAYSQYGRAGDFNALSENKQQRMESHSLSDGKIMGGYSDSNAQEAVAITSSSKSRRRVSEADEYYRKGDIEKATASFLEAIKQVPWDKSLYFKLAEMLIDGKKYDDALGILESVPHGDNDIRKLALLGCCEEGLGHNDKAQEYAAHALAIDPSMALALNIAGVVAHKKGERDIAEGLFKKAIDSDPSFGESYTNLGSLQWAAGRHIEALNLFERGFILSPTVADVVTAYHSAVADTGSFARAEPVFRDARALHPNDKRIGFFLIAMLIQQEKYNLAMIEIENAMIQFRLDDGILNAALQIRAKTGPLEIRPGSKRKSMSICMIVKNEELNLAKCLMSVKPVADEIIVVDTGSTDKTKAIASALGAKVFDFTWTNDFSEARNYSLSKASGNLILVLDADEIVSPLDHDKLKKLINSKGKERVAYTMVTRNYTNQAGARGWTANEGRYIHEEAGRGWFPSPKVRLFVNDKRINFTNPVHELVEPALEKLGIKIKTCDVPIQHYGRLNQDKLIAKGKEYYRLGIAKIEKAQGNYNALKELGIQAAEIGEYEEAVHIWQKVLDVKPRDPVAFMNMGYAHLMLEQYEKAKVFSKNALDLDPELREAALNYSASELIAGDVKMAISTLEKVLKKHPDYPPAFGRMAAACLVGGRKNDGVGYLDRLHAKGFNCANVLEEQARALHAQGKNEQAVILLEVALEKGMANGRIQPLLAECRQKMKYSSCVTQ